MKKSKKVIIRQDLKWYIALSYVDVAETLSVYHSDKGFCKIVDKMRDYINAKIDLPNDGEITDMYVAIEQDVPVEEE